MTSVDRAGRRLVARSFGGGDNYLRLYDACDTTRRLAENSHFRDGYPYEALLLWTNQDAAPRRVILEVERYEGRPVATRRVAIAFVDLAPNASCAGAALLEPGVTLFGQRGVRGEQVLDGLDCTLHSSPPSKALWYRVRVPAGQVCPGAASNAPSYYALDVPAGQRAAPRRRSECRTPWGSSAPRGRCTARAWPHLGRASASPRESTITRRSPTPPACTGGAPTTSTTSMRSWTVIET